MATRKHTATSKARLAAKPRAKAKKRNTMGPNPSARAYERANPNARFKRTSPSPPAKSSSSTTKKMPVTYRTQAARARAKRSY